MDSTPVQAEDRLAAVIIFTIASIGFTVNVFIVFHVRRLAVFQCPFGHLLRLQAIADGLFAGIWALCFAPALLFDIKAIRHPAVAARLGQFCLICYNLSLYCHLIISLNRFTAIYFSRYYAMIFTNQFSTVIIPCIVVLSVCDSTFLTLVSCEMGFSIKLWKLVYVTPPCDTSLVYYAEFVRSLSVISILAVMDSLTFIKMNFHNRKELSIAYNTSEQRRRRGIERRFVKQVTLQGVLFVAELVSYFYVDEFFPITNKEVVGHPNRWPKFLITTIAWILVPTLDGIVVLIFNEQLYNAIPRSFKMSKHRRTSTKIEPRKSLSPQTIDITSGL